MLVREEVIELIWLIRVTLSGAMLVI